MELSQKIIAAILAVFFLVALLRVFRTPLKVALRLFGNTVLGFLTLAAVNLFSGVTGISLGLNPLNALILGVLGVPGFALLLLIRWLL